VIRSIPLALALLLTAFRTDGAAAPGTVTTTSGAEVQYADTGATPLVTYSEIAGVVGTGPTLTVFGDGSVIAEYPPGWKRAGRHRARLSKAELAALVATIVDAGVVDFDADAVQRAVRTAESGARAGGTGPQLFEVSDPDVTVITVSLERYQRAGGPAATNVDKRVAWQSLSRDVRQHPTIGALTKLESARQALRAVLVRHDFAREN
jgi:hypothetical protein